MSQKHCMECVVSVINTVYYYPPPDQLRQYITQLRQELGMRLVEKVYASGDKPSKVRPPTTSCMCTSEKEGKSQSKRYRIFVPTSECSRVQFLITRFILHLHSFATLPLLQERIRTGG